MIMVCVCVCMHVCTCDCVYAYVLCVCVLGGWSERDRDRNKETQRESNLRNINKSHASDAWLIQSLNFGGFVPLRNMGLMNLPHLSFLLGSLFSWLSCHLEPCFGGQENA